MHPRERLLRTIAGEQADRVPLYFRLFGFRPPPHLKGIYKDADLKLPAESDTWITYTNNHPFVGALFPMNALYRGYCETVVSLDEQIGRVMAKLEELHLIDDTIVVYAGDNGHFWGEHGLYDKRLAYEESIRIPLKRWYMAKGWTIRRTTRVRASRWRRPMPPEPAAPATSAGLAKTSKWAGSSSPKWA